MYHMFYNVDMLPYKHAYSKSKVNYKSNDKNLSIANGSVTFNKNKKNQNAIVSVSNSPMIDRFRLEIRLELF